MSLHLARWFVVVGLLLLLFAPIARAQTPTPAVVINEFMPRPSGTGSEEWVELYNPNPYPVDIGGWKIDNAADGGTMMIVPAGIIIKATACMWSPASVIF